MTYDDFEKIGEIKFDNYKDLMFEGQTTLTIIIEALDAQAMAIINSDDPGSEEELHKFSQILAVKSQLKRQVPLW